MRFEFLHNPPPETTTIIQPTVGLMKELLCCGHMDHKWWQVGDILIKAYNEHSNLVWINTTTRRQVRASNIHRYGVTLGNIEPGVASIRFP